MPPHRHSPTNTGILIVEHDDQELSRINDAFSRYGITNPICNVRNVGEAADYLAGIGRFSNRQQFPLPKMIILGSEASRSGPSTLLLWRTNMPFTRDVPVIFVFSREQQHEEMINTYRLGFTGVVQKTSDFKSLIEMIGSILDSFPIRPEPEA